VEYVYSYILYIVAIQVAIVRVYMSHEQL
jgi:hypothetical protein